MANCKTCGGVLDRDCFNEHDCLMISHSQEQELHQNIEHSEDYIQTLIYTLEQNKIPVPNSFSAEPPLIMKIPYGCENKYIDDGLPF